MSHKSTLSIAEQTMCHAHDHHWHKNGIPWSHRMTEECYPYHQCSPEHVYTIHVWRWTPGQSDNTHFVSLSKEKMWFSVNSTTYRIVPGWKTTWECLNHKQWTIICPPWSEGYCPNTQPARLSQDWVLGKYPSLHGGEMMVYCLWFKHSHVVFQPGTILSVVYFDENYTFSPQR